MKYGEIWRESLGDNLFRYCVIISPDSMNRDLETLLTVPVVSRLRPWPTRVGISLKNSKRQIQCEQLHTTMKGQLVEKIAQLSLAETAKLRLTLKSIFLN